MRILVVSQYFWPENFRINDLVFEWKSKGYEVEILTGKPNYPGGKIFKNYKDNPNEYQFFKECKIHRVPIILRGSASKFDLLINYMSFLINAFFYSIIFLRKKNYDIVFTFATSPVTVGLLSIFISKLTRSKTVIWVLDLWPDIIYELGIIKNKFILFILKKIVIYMYRNSGYIYAQSNSFLLEIAKVTNRDKIDLLHSWPEKINFNCDQRSNLLEYKDDYLNIIFAGSIGETQNLKELVSVFKELVKEKVRLIIIGDGREKSDLENLVKSNKLNSIIFIDQQPLNKIPELVLHADILLLSLKVGKVGSYTIPGKFSTYLKFGLPILCHAKGEVSEIVKNNNFGLCSNPGDTNTLKKNILSLKDLKDKNKIDIFKNSKNFELFNFDKSFIRLGKKLLSFKKKITEIRLITSPHQIPYNENFILSGLNLAFLGSFISDKMVIDKRFIHWPDGIFAQRYYEKTIKKMTGRYLMSNLKIPKKINTIHVLGDLDDNGYNYLKNKYQMHIRHTKLRYGSVKEIVQDLPDINENELVVLTLPTPKQEHVAIELSNINDNYKILCTGGAINMIVGSEAPVPKYLERYFEGLWRLRFDTKRRFKRLITTGANYLSGVINGKFKNVVWKFYKD